MKLLDTFCKATMFTVFKELRDKLKKFSKNLGAMKSGRADFLKNQIEIWELINTILKAKTLTDMCNSKWDTAKERISKVEDKLEKIIQKIIWKEKRMKNTQERVRDIKHTVKT